MTLPIDPALRRNIEAAFPNLANDNWEKTSEATPQYNCIAHAAEDSIQKWWPSDPRLGGPGYWPPNVDRAESMLSFYAAFRTLGYERCNGPELEEGYEKVAIYSTTVGIPKHAARQLPCGGWTSKLGDYIDIRHSTPTGVAGQQYGTRIHYMRRKKHSATVASVENAPSSAVETEGVNS